MMGEQLHITADKRLRYASPKFAYRQTSFIRETLYSIVGQLLFKGISALTF